jgi:hypothetical protein
VKIIKKCDTKQKYNLTPSKSIINLTCKLSFHNISISVQWKHHEEQFICACGDFAGDCGRLHFWVAAVGGGIVIDSHWMTLSAVESQNLSGTTRLSLWMPIVDALYSHHLCSMRFRGDYGLSM